MRNSSLQLLKENGGGSSVVCLLYLCMISILCALLYTKMQAVKEIEIANSTMWKGHFLWLEAIYYARNEINDETLWDWHESGEDYQIDVEFDRMKKQVIITAWYRGIRKVKKYFYDFDCHCIFETEQ